SNARRGLPQIWRRRLVKSQPLRSLEMFAPPLLAPDDAESACGDDPGRVCEWVFEQSDGNATLAELADWLVDRPLRVLLVLLVAWIVTRLARRWVRGVVRRVVDPDHSAAIRQ